MQFSPRARTSASPFSNQRLRRLKRSRDGGRLERGKERPHRGTPRAITAELCERRQGRRARSPKANRDKRKEKQSPARPSCLRSMGLPRIHRSAALDRHAFTDVFILALFCAKSERFTQTRRFKCTQAQGACVRGDTVFLRRCLLSVAQLCEKYQRRRLLMQRKHLILDKQLSKPMSNS